MEDKDKKIELAHSVEALELGIERLKNENQPMEFISLIDRAKNLINVSILYFSELSASDISSINTILKLCDAMVKSENVHVLSTYTDNLYTLVESLEEVYREKKFLLESMENAQISY